MIKIPRWAKITALIIGGAFICLFVAAGISVMFFPDKEMKQPAQANIQTSHAPTAQAPTIEDRAKVEAFFKQVLTITSAADSSEERVKSAFANNDTLELAGALPDAKHQMMETIWKLGGLDIPDIESDEVKKELADGVKKLKDTYTLKEYLYGKFADYLDDGKISNLADYKAYSASATVEMAEGLSKLMDAVNKEGGDGIALGKEFAR